MGTGPLPTCCPAVTHSRHAVPGGGASAASAGGGCAGCARCRPSERSGIACQPAASGVLETSSTLLHTPGLASTQTGSCASPLSHRCGFIFRRMILTPAPQARGPTKRCRRCGTDRPTSEFHRQQSRPDGLYSYCVFCAAEYKQARKLSRMREQEPPPPPVCVAVVRRAFPDKCLRSQPPGIAGRASQCGNFNSYAGLAGRCDESGV